MMNNKKRKNYFVVVMIVVILVLATTIGYSLVSKLFKLNGTAHIDKVTWSIYVLQDDIKARDSYCGVDPNDNNKKIFFTQESKLPKVQEVTSDPNNAYTQITFSTAGSLNAPGDFYEFTVPFKNHGSIDAKLAQINVVSGISTEASSYLDFNMYVVSDAETDDVTEIEDNVSDLGVITPFNPVRSLPANDGTNDGVLYLRFKVSYKAGVTELPSEQLDDSNIIVDILFDQKD